MNNGRIILASKSPRRKEILEKAGYDIEIRIQDADETLPNGISPEKAVEMLAEIKASAVKREKRETVVGADTVVAVDGEILENRGTKMTLFQCLEGFRAENIMCLREFA